MAIEPKFVDATDEVGEFKSKEGSEILRRPMLVDVDGDGFEDIPVLNKVSFLDLVLYRAAKI